MIISESHLPEREWMFNAPIDPCDKCGNSDFLTEVEVDGETLHLCGPCFDEYESEVGVMIDMETIVKKWLRAHGYDGLYNDWMECGCRLDEFMPCGEPGTDCQAAYDHGPRQGSNHWMAPNKPEGES